jgi:prepilin-type N-terminal cleavage/methylation domain-containing protein
MAAGWAGLAAEAKGMSRHRVVRHRLFLGLLVRRPGLTLVELLAVIAIIGLLVALLLPAVQGAREASRRIACMGKVKQLITAYIRYNETLGHVPRAWYGLGRHGNPHLTPPPNYPPGPYQRGNLFWELMPFSEQLAIFERVGGDMFNGGGASFPPNMQMPGFLCATDSRFTVQNNSAGPFWALSNYAVNFQVAGRPKHGDNVATASATCAADPRFINNSFPQVADPMATNLTPHISLGGLFLDGAGMTVVFGEKYRVCGSGINSPGNIWGHGPWGMQYMPLFAYGNSAGTAAYTLCGGQDHNNVGPASKPQSPGPPVATMGPNTCSIMRTQAIHVGIMTTGFGDGSTRSISDTIDGDTWWAICTPREQDTPREF